MVAAAVAMGLMAVAAVAAVAAAAATTEVAAVTRERGVPEMEWTAVAETAVGTTALAAEARVRVVRGVVVQTAPAPGRWATE